jgi:hypothetical protein
MSGLMLLQLWLQTLAFPDRVRREMMLHQTELRIGLNDQDEVAQHGARIAIRTSQNYSMSSVLCEMRASDL